MHEPASTWGDKVVEEFAAWLQEKDPSVRNFDRRNIYRMREFFLSWHNVNWSLGSSGLSKDVEERVFYILLTQREKYTVYDGSRYFPGQSHWLQ